MTPLLGKFPFNPDASADATLAEVGAVLAPNTGSLWAFQQERLAGILEKQGDQWVQKPTSPVALSAPFVAFFNRAARVSDALYAGGPEPRVVLTARGLGKQATLFQGAQAAKLGGQAPPAQLVWPSTSGREARLELGYRDLVVLGRTKVVARAGGEWALFRLVAQAAKWDGNGGTWRAEWNAGGQGPVAVEFSFANGQPVLQRGWLGGMACPAQVTR
jgi:type VI secretion system protein ImpL